MNGHLSPAEISGFVDGETELDGKGKEHLSSCSRCSALLEEQRKLRRMARAAKPEVPTGRMWAVIKDGISREPARPFWSFLWARPGRLAAGTLGTVAVAALVLIVSRQVVEAPGISPAEMAKPGPVVQEKAVRKADGEENRKVEREAAREDTLASAPATPKVVAPAPKKAAAAGPSEENAAPSGKAEEGGRYAPVAAEIAAAPAAAPRAKARLQSAAIAGAVPRVSFKGKRFLLEADNLDSSVEGVVRATGRVIVRPAGPGLSCFAVVDGLSRTLTGTQEAVAADIFEPGERLILRTRQ
jgi:hypothetical protein